MTKIVDSAGFEALADKWINDGVTGAYNDRLRKVVFQLLRMIMTASPVDTGRFVGSWDVSLDHFSSWEFGEGPGTRRAAEAQSRNRANNAMDALKGEFQLIPKYIGLSNNVPYAKALEYGVVTGTSSRSGGSTMRAGSIKSGTGFVRASVEAVKSMLRAGRFK